MSASALLVSTAMHAPAPARMARCLATAGFEVSALAPRDSLVAKSRYVRRIGHLPQNATAGQWVHGFAATVKATAPALVLPCDDTSFRLMQLIVLAPPRNLQPALQRELALRVTASLGSPAFYRASVDKTLLCPAAAALGVRVPPYVVVEDRREAEAFAGEHGYPVVAKRGHSTAGEGVAICSNAMELAQAFATLRLPDPTGIVDVDGRRLLVQAHIPGRIQYYAGVAWKGGLISGMGVEKVAGVPKGPSTVSRYFRSDALRDFSSRLARGFGINGIFAPEFAIHERSGEPYLLELNRRMTHGTHRGAAMNVDVGAALHCALSGAPMTTRTDLDEGEEHLCVHFPSEWLRDPESAWLRDHPVDVPWDEPELIEAMLAMRRNS
ncbi:MAG: hypothetical protein ACM3QY_03840 [Candidatus Levyibacteriota bacterium]